MLSAASDPVEPFYNEKSRIQGPIVRYGPGHLLFDTASGLNGKYSPTSFPKLLS